MRLTTTLIAGLFTLALPTATLAYGCERMTEAQSASCASGTQWDEETGTCVAIPST